MSRNSSDSKGGFGGDYSGIFSGVLADLEALQEHYETMGWLAELGIGSTAEDISALIDAFEELGTSAADLKAAAIEAAGTGRRPAAMGMELTAYLKPPFQNVIDTDSGGHDDRRHGKPAYRDRGYVEIETVTGIGGSMAERNIQYRGHV